MLNTSNAGCLRLVLTEREIARAELANTLAFGQADFLPERLTDLLRQMPAYDLSENLLVEWRRWFLKVAYADSSCSSCHSAVTLDESDLMSGRFACPDCKLEQLVHYAYLEPQSEFTDLHRLNDLLLPESDDSLIDWQTLPDSLTDEDLLSLLSQAGPKLTRATSNQIICRLALRGVTVDRLLDSIKEIGDSKPLYQPFNHMDFLGGNNPVYLGYQQEEIENPEVADQTPTSQPPESDPAIELPTARTFHRDREEVTHARTISHDLAGGLIRVMLTLSSLTIIVVWILLPPIGSTVRAILDRLLGGWSIDWQDLMAQSGFAASVLAVLSIATAYSLLTWLRTLRRSVERNQTPDSGFEPSQYGVFLLAPLLFYPSYFRLAANIRERVVENSLGVGSVDLASAHNSSRFFTAMRTLAANPSLLMLFAFWNLFVWWKCAYSEGEIQSLWWKLLPIQLLTQLLCGGYVRLIMRSRSGARGTTLT